MRRGVLLAMLVALVGAGLAVAGLAFGAAAHKRRATPHYARVVSECPPAVARGAQPTPAFVPSRELLSAFGVLRRDRVAGDALPAWAEAALRARGAVFDPSTARLLRNGTGAADAWIVPVQDVHALDGFSVFCGPLLRRGVNVAPVPVPARPTMRRRAAPRALRAPRALPPLPVPMIVPAVPALPVRPSAPEEGVAVVSVAGAPAGGGGALDDILRGRAAPGIVACANGGQLTSVSGVVPDGVAAVFMTSPDGTAIKADVTENAYQFLVAPLSSPKARYVVWLKDGLPKVHALPRTALRVRCGNLARPAHKGMLQITPGAPLPVLPAIVQRVPRKFLTRPALPRLVRPVPVPTGPARPAVPTPTP